MMVIKYNAEQGLWRMIRLSLIVVGIILISQLNFLGAILTIAGFIMCCFDDLKKTKKKK